MDPAVFGYLAQIQDEHWWFAARRRIVGAVLETCLAREVGRRILDVGCGTGSMLPVLSRFGQVTAIDPSAEALEWCRTARGGDLDLRLGSLPDDPPAGRFDVVTAFDVIEHIEDDARALARIAELLRPGGTFVCTVPAFQFLWGPHDEVSHHYRRYTRSTLGGALAAAGFRIRRLTYFNCWLFPLVSAVRLGRRLLPGGTGPAEHDLAMPPRWINQALTRVFASEARLVTRLPLPVGVSLLAVADTA